MLRNLVTGLVLNRQIETTLTRAKETSRFADQMVTLAKQGTLAARREIIRHLGSPEIAGLLIGRIAPKFLDRNGGYTRVLKTWNRPGDGAQKAIVSFTVPIELLQPKKKVKKAKKKKEKVEKEVKKEVKPQKLEKVERPAEKPAEKKETEKRGGFLSKLRKFLTGDENKP